MPTPIAITGLGSLSAAGSLGSRPVRFQKPNRSDAMQDPNSKKHFLTFNKDLKSWVGALPAGCKSAIEKIRDENKNYKHLDPTVLYAIHTSRLATAQAGWDKGGSFGINIGSSRGATQLFERFYYAFAKAQPLHPMSSPSTTLGNISSWVAQDLQNSGPEISHSITCSTSMHALLNGVAWLRSGMCKRFLVGGSEAALTPFTIAQMTAMKVLSQAKPSDDLPCRALDLCKMENTMVLGEGAASVCLELGESKNALAYIIGMGYATEKLKHAASISAEGECFQKSMRMAIKEAGKIGLGMGTSDHDKKPSAIDHESYAENNFSLNYETSAEPCAEPSRSAEVSVDAIVMHAPGTIAGDLTEYRAIQKVFGANLPVLTSNKWKIGHTFGPSGLLSLELAVDILKTQQIEPSPFFSAQAKPKKIEHILVNSVGFGGNAVSVIVQKA